MRDLTKYSVLVKDANGEKEIVRPKVTSLNRDEEILTVECDSALFDEIDKVVVVFYNANEAFSYKGTIRKVHYSTTEVMIALYRKEEISNRVQQRYPLEANINVLRYIKNGKLTELEPPVFGKLLDISARGARLQVAVEFLEVGDFVAFQILDKSVKKLLFAKVVRVAADEKYNHQYGLQLLENSPRGNNKESNN